MKPKLLLTANIILSSSLFGLFVFYTTQDFLHVGNSWIWILSPFFPFSLFFLLAGVSLIHINKLSSKLKYLPPVLYTLAILVGAGLFLFNYLNPDYGFFQRFQDYEGAVELIENGQVKVNERGFAKLPPTLADTSFGGHAQVYEDAEVTMIYFLDGYENLDGFSWGYLYRSDGNQPTQSELTYRDGCRRWRELKPSTSQWFFCEVHSLRLP